MTQTKLPDNIKITYVLGVKAYYNSETDGYYSNLADAKMAPRLEKAQASDRWIEFWNKAMADYDDTPICPSCKHLLTGLHSSSCNGFTKIVRNKAVRLFEKAEKEAS